MLDQPASRVKVVYDRVRILGRACRENTHFVMFVGGLKEFVAKRADVETDIFHDGTAGRCDIYLDFGWASWVRILDAMHQSFVQVQQQHLFHTRLFELHFNLFL